MCFPGKLLMQQQVMITKGVEPPYSVDSARIYVVMSPRTPGEDLSSLRIQDRSTSTTDTYPEPRARLNLTLRSLVRRSAQHITTQELVRVIMHQTCLYHHLSRLSSDRCCACAHGRTVLWLTSAQQCTGRILSPRTGLKCVRVIP
jgi:hypothetical protein